MDVKYHQKLLKALAAVLAKVSPVTVSKPVLYNEPLYVKLPREVDDLGDLIRLCQSLPVQTASTGYKFDAHSKNEFAYKLWLKHPVVLGENLDKNWAAIEDILEKIDSKYEKTEKGYYWYTGLQSSIAKKSDKLSGLGPSNRVVINTDHIEDFALADALERHQTEPGRSGTGYANEEAMKWLKKFMATTGVGSPDYEVKKELEALRPDKDVVVYRGKGWNKPELRLLGDNIKSYPFKKGSALTFKYTRPSSWTTNRRVAEEFAHGTGPFWVILKYTAKPEDVLVDTRKLNEEQLAELYNYGFQREIILKPGSYKAEVETIGFEDDDTLTTGWDENPQTWVDLQDMCDKVGEPLGYKSGTAWRKHYNGAIGLNWGTVNRGAVVPIFRLTNGGWSVRFDQWRGDSVEEVSGLSKSFDKIEELEEYLKSQEFRNALSSLRPR